MEALQAMSDDFEVLEAPSGSQSGASFGVSCPPVGPLLVNLPAQQEALQPSLQKGCADHRQLRWSRVWQLLLETLLGKNVSMKLCLRCPEVAAAAGVEEQPVPQDCAARSEEAAGLHNDRERVMSDGQASGWAAETSDGTLVRLSVTTGPKAWTI
ncbi:unnamed protein product [Effrenium voratum]|nr:unnamed protein product [Effrenium voratum]